MNGFIRLGIVLCMCVLTGTACRKSSTSFAVHHPAGDEFSVMSFNLTAYSLADRDADGQADDPKPRAEQEAIIALIANVKPDILAVQEIGSPALFETFQRDLAQAGLSFTDYEYQQREHAELNLAVLSRFPIVVRQSHMDDRYRMGKEEVPVTRGFIEVEVQVTPQYSFRLLTAHLPSRDFHELGQTEMRRNEARLLNNHVRRALKESPDVNLLVAGTMNDDPDSAAIRELVGEKEPCLTDLRPIDALGDAWTHVDRTRDVYDRMDYLFVSAAMQTDVVKGKTMVIRDPAIDTASDHRPLLAVFKKRNVPAHP